MLRVGDKTRADLESVQEVDEMLACVKFLRVRMWEVLDSLLSLCQERLALCVFTTNPFLLTVHPLDVSDPVPLDFVVVATFPVSLSLLILRSENCCELLFNLLNLSTDSICLPFHIGLLLTLHF